MILDVDILLIPLTAFVTAARRASGSMGMATRFAAADRWAIETTCDGVSSPFSASKSRSIGSLAVAANLTRPLSQPREHARRILAGNDDVQECRLCVVRHD